MLKEPDQDRSLIIHDINSDKTLAICLCAGWCDNCREWKAEFAALAEQLCDCCFVWLDIDEHPDMVAEVDLDILPVLVIYKGETAVFSGPVRPDGQTVGTLIKGAQPNSLCDDPGIRDFLME